MKNLYAAMSNKVMMESFYNAAIFLGNAENIVLLNLQHAAN